jgi:hypothetical protein
MVKPLSERAEATCGIDAQPTFVSDNSGARAGGGVMEAVLAVRYFALTFSFALRRSAQ